MTYALIQIYLGYQIWPILHYSQTFEYFGLNSLYDIENGGAGAMAPLEIFIRTKLMRTGQVHLALLVLDGGILPPKW